MTAGRRRRRRRRERSRGGCRRREREGRGRRLQGGQDRDPPPVDAQEGPDPGKAVQQPEMD